MFLVATSILEKLEQTERMLDEDNICSHLSKYKADFYIDGSWQYLFYSKPSRFRKINNLLVAFSGNIYNMESQDEKILNAAVLQRIACAEDNAMIEALNCTYGDFNGLIIDKTSKEIRLVGSRSGLPPLYYYLEKELFLVAEELDILLKIVFACNRSLRLNKKYIGTFLVGICDEEFAVDPTITIYDKVYVVPPAHIVYLSEGTKKIKRYWIYWKSNSLGRSNIEEKLRQLLFQAVSVRVSTPFSMGVRLSGGLDSGSIACILGKILHNSFYCYSNVFDFSKSLDEKYYVEKISRHISASVRYIPADYLWALRDIPNLSRRPQPEPYQGWFYRQEQSIAEAAMRDGTHTLMDGVGGDELFSPSFISYRFSSNILYNKFRDNYALYISSIRRGSFPDDIAIPCLPDKNIIPNFLEQKFLNDIDLYDLIEYPFLQLLELDLDFLTYYRLLSFRFNNNYIKDCIWLQREILTPAGIQSSHPFLDQYLIEFIFQLPISNLIIPLVNKFLLRRAVRNDIPASLYRRKLKTEFSPLITKGLIEEKSRLTSIVNKCLLAELGIVKKTEFIAEFNSLLKYSDLYSTDNPHYSAWLWQALTLEIWIQDQLLRGTLSV